MTNYQIGELLLVEFPFTASGPGKSRPALVILDTGDADVILARVTTQAHGSPFDVPIAAWQQAGLLAPSTVRLHKLATLAKNRVHKCLGKLEATDRRSLGHAKECGHLFRARLWTASSDPQKIETLIYRKLIDVAEEAGVDVEGELCPA
jgi:mRNA interferase MazF